MTISVDIQNITRAEAMTHKGDDYGGSFDTAEIYTESSYGIVTLYLPHGTGQAVADAINAAVTK